MEGPSRRRPAARSSSRLFENYEIHRLLGTGTYGAVFDCMNKFEKRNYAVKVMKFDAVDTEREISNLVQIPNHPNLVQYFTCWKDAFGREDVGTIRQRFGDEDLGDNNFIIPTGLRSFDAICILMELCGEDLRQWLGYRDTVDEFTSVNIFQQIAQGVNHLHTNGLIHRDLKPENIFFSKLDANIVKLGDLGIATKTNRSRHTSGIGTRAYLAPEQEGSLYGPGVDIFAIGIIFLELLYPPMQPGTDEEEGKAGNHTKVVIGLKYLHSVPEEVFRLWPVAADLILKMVSIEVEDRPHFPEIFETLQNIGRRWDNAHPEETVAQNPPEVQDVQEQVVNIPAIQINSSRSTSSGYDSIGNDDSTPNQQPEMDESADPAKPRDPVWHTAESSDHLESLLENINPGDTIELLKSIEYSGDFTIHTTNITLVGNEAIILGSNISFKIQANDCTLKNMHLQGDTGLFVCGNGNIIESITVGIMNPPENTNEKNETIFMKELSCGFLLQGNNNSFRNCTVIGQQKGVVSTGDGNDFDAIKIVNCAKKSFVVQGSSNSFQNLECTNCPNGIWIAGDENRVLGMVYKLSEEFARRYKYGQVSSGCAITFGKGKDNFVSNFRNFAQPGQCKNGLQTSIYVSKLKVVDSCVGKLYLEGNDHSVENSTALLGAVVVGNQNYFKEVNFTRLELQGTLHKLYKCNADHFLKHGSGCDVEIIRCNFD